MRSNRPWFSRSSFRRTAAGNPQGRSVPRCLANFPEPDTGSYSRRSTLFEPGFPVLLQHSPTGQIEAWEYVLKIFKGTIRRSTTRSTRALLFERRRLPRADLRRRCSIWIALWKRICADLMFNGDLFLQVSLSCWIMLPRPVCKGACNPYARYLPDEHGEDSCQRRSPVYY